MSSSQQARHHECDIDLFSVEQVMDPYPTLHELQDLGPAVYMTSHDYWVLTRYDDVRAATMDWQTFTSSEGVALFEGHNENTRGSVLAAEPPRHDQLRSIFSEKLAPRALGAIRDGIRQYAEELVATLTARGEFDGVTDLARVFPVNVVADLIGLPAEGRERLNPGADAVFTAVGPYTPMLEERLPVLTAYFQYIDEMATVGRLREGSWGDEVMTAVAEGVLSERDGLTTLASYLTAGMDTTVQAIAAMMQIFAEQPEVWEAVRDEPSTRPMMLAETLRWSSPIRGFFRVAAREVAVGDTVIPAGQRVLLHWAAANRDPRHFPEPDRFDFERNPVDHLAFGYGIHSCAGQGLARLEAAELLDALAARVVGFRLTGPVVKHYNPVIQALDSVPLGVTTS